MRDHVRFLLGSEQREIGAIDPTMTVLDWLRAAERRVGTKEGCAEGDCGACTVVIGRPDGGRLRTCSIVTTRANDTVAPLHDRMPVILPPSAWDAWLDPANWDTVTLARLLVPAPAELLTAHPVSDLVNSVRNNGPQLVAEVAG